MTPQYATTEQLAATIVNEVHEMTREWAREIVAICDDNDPYPGDTARMQEIRDAIGDGYSSVIALIDTFDYFVSR